MGRLADIKGRVMLAMANAGARNRTWADRVARAALGIALAPPRRDNFMADELVDTDRGFSPEDLGQYQASKADTPFQIIEGDATRR